MIDSRASRNWFVGTLSFATALIIVVTVVLLAVPVWHEYRIVRALKAVDEQVGFRVDRHSVSATNRYDPAIFKGDEFQGRSAAIALAKVIRDGRREPPLRWIASMVLSSSQSDALAAIPILNDALRGNDEMGRYLSSYAFRAFGDAGVPALIQALNHENPHVRRCAADALGNIGPEAAHAIPALTDAVRGGHWLSRLAAAAALGKIGADARSAIPAITGLLEDTTLRDEALNDERTESELREQMFTAFQQHARKGLERLNE